MLEGLKPKEIVELSQQLKALPEEKRKEFFDSLSANEAIELLYNPYFQLRPDQAIEWSPEKPIILMLCARAFGKSFTASRIIKAKILEGAKEIVLVCPTHNDIVQTMLMGPSGLFSAYHPSDADYPEFVVSQNIVKFKKSGARIRLVSAENVERSRGINSELLVFDELGSVENAEELVSNLLFGLRIGKAEALFITSPRTTKTIIDLYNRRDADVQVIHGTSFANRENLSDNFFKNTEAYKGTARYRQEVLGELILQNDDALWTSDMIDNSKISNSEVPWHSFKKIAIGCDPSQAGGSNPKSKASDEFGIVVAAIDTEDNIYILEDRTGKHTTEQWLANLKQCYSKWSEYAPVMVVVEANGVGAYVQEVIQRDMGRIPIKTIKSSVSKLARAEPVSLLYIQRKVFHPRDAELTKLEQEMTTYSGVGKSPNHLDAMVFAVLELNPVKKSSSKVFRFSF